MTAIFYAQPYDMDATGFYFHTEEDYTQAVKTCRNVYGQVVEEFEIQFIDGLTLNSKLAKAIEPNQCNIFAMMRAMATWTEEQKIKVYLAVHEGGADFDIENNHPDDLDIDLYHDMHLRDLAYQFVDDGLFGDIPNQLARYLDYQAIARDLGHDYSEAVIGGDSYLFRLV